MLPDLKVQGHRGCAAHHPENSIEGVCAALAAGAFAVEIDVQLTGDNGLVVLHDSVLHPPGYRIDQPLTVAQASLCELTAIIFGDRSDERFSHLLSDRFPVSVPSLQNLLEHPFISAKQLTIELKADERRRYNAYADALESILHNRTVFRIKSFDWQLLIEAHRRMPEQSYHYLLPEGWRGGELDELRRMPWLQGVCMHHSQVTESTVPDFHSRNLHVSVYTVNSEDIARDLYAKGVRDILSDDPQRMIDQLVLNNRDSNPRDALT